MESSYCEENAANNIISKIKQEYIPGVKNFDKESNKSKEVSNKKCVKVEPKEVANAFLKPTVIPNAERKASITQISNVKKEIRKIITPVANSNSKWAQFVEKEQEEDDTKEIESFQVINGTLDRAKVFEDLDQSGVYKNSQELFALCGDNDLDDVLDF
ncbi:hypothetical protein O0L34_g12320 [Tuta absoluta]|nr:hypothetical protein O0L34_g12320 [Tuta absoluta]